MIDYTIKGTKLPTIPNGIEYRVDYWSWDGIKNNIDFYDNFKNYRDKLVSFGTKEYLGETYILAEKPEYEETSYFMFKLEDLNKLTNNNMQENMNILKVNQRIPEIKGSETVTAYNKDGSIHKEKYFRRTTVENSIIKEIHNDLFQLKGDNTIWFNISDFIEKEIIGYKIIKQYPGLRKEYVGTIILSPIYKLPDTTMVPGTIFEKDNSYYNADFIKEFFEPIYKEEFTYKVGDYLYCIKDFVNDHGETRFKKDKVYKSENPQCITNESDNKHHQMNYNLDEGMIDSKHGHLSNYFRHATPEEVEKLKEERIVMAEGFELIIKDNEIIHEKDNTDITNYVKSIDQWWRNTCQEGNLEFEGFSFTLKPRDITINRTGCQQDKGTTLKQWLDLYDKIK